MEEFSISINNHQIGNGNKAFIIAEVAQAHDGSLGNAHAYIDAVAEARADAIKFQTHIAEEESTFDESFRVDIGYQDKTRYDYWKRMGFTEVQWKGLVEHSREKGLVFLSSPFSVKAVEMLSKIDMPAWKVGSGEIYTPDLMSAIIDTKAPVILSTGMCDYGEVNNITKMLRQKGVQFALLQCTSRYPVSLEEVGLNVIEEYRSRFKCPVGLSDHSGSVYPSLTAMARNADLIEVHVVMDRKLYGFDVAASITIDELAMLIKARDAIYLMDQNPVNKDNSAAGMADMKLLFSKSVAPSRALSKGTVLTKDMLMLKKPGSGIKSHEREGLIGRRLRKNVSPERLLKWDDIEL